MLSWLCTLCLVRDSTQAWQQSLLMGRCCRRTHWNIPGAVKDLGTWGAEALRQGWAACLKDPQVPVAPPLKSSCPPGLSLHCVMGVAALMISELPSLFQALKQCHLASAEMADQLLNVLTWPHLSWSFPNSSSFFPIWIG